MTSRTRERGEGKIGCIISLIVLIAVAAAGLKIVPVLYSNNNLEDAALRKAETAAGRPIEDLQKELKAEAQKLEIMEALAPGAIVISKHTANVGGTITVVLKFTRKVDLYGITQFDIVTDKRIDQPLYENIR